MEFSLETWLLVAAGFLFCGILISKTGYCFGIPTLLTFLIVGMLFGTDGLGVQFSNALTAQYIGTVALCVILFSGGMDTRMSDVNPVLAPGIMLSTVGVLLTTLFTGLFVFWISGWQHTEIGFSLLGSLLLAATISSTDSASVFNILRSQKIGLNHNLRPMLELESGSNDPMAYLLTVILIQCVHTGDLSGWDIVLSFLLQFAVGIAGGYVAGRIGVWIVNRIGLRNGELYSVLVLSMVFIIYCAVNLAGGNGFLAVYLSGMVFGNRRLFKHKEICTFLDGLTWLLQIVLFVMLGLLVNPHEMLSVVVAALLVSLFMSFIARPLSVWLSLLPFGKRIGGKSKIFISWVGLRGAAPIIFATYPVVEEVSGAEQIFNIVFFVTLVSLLFQGMSIPWMAKKMGLNEPQGEKESNFGIEIPEEIGGKLHELTCTPDLLSHGRRIKDIPFPEGELVVLIRRKDEFLVPKGGSLLEEGDILLLISRDAETTQSLL
mgnify:CR=1 FL=1